VCTDYGALAEFGTETGALVVPMGGGDPTALPPDFASQIASLINDRGRLTELGCNADRTRQERSAPRIAEAFVQAWSEMLDQQHQRV
jgi:hypothetical protein